MAKPAQKSPNRDLLGLDRSVFTLTFAIEILGLDVWHDCNEGWVDLGPCSQGMKIHYQLYPGQNFDIDILIWPHVAKIWCGMNSGWVRTWQFLERRWLAFDISHIFPVRTVELKDFVATVSPTVGMGALGTNAKNDKVAEVFMPRLEFRQQRYFAPVIEKPPSLHTFLSDLIWQTVEDYIPASYLDGLFDVPHPVADVRHQDTVIHNVKESILGRTATTSELKLNPSKQGLTGSKKKLEPQKIQFEVNLSGNDILAGAGRQVAFQAVGDRPPEMGEFFVYISSQNLPANDDFPIFFVNIDSIVDVPVEALKKYHISHIYTQWSMGEETHNSQPKPLGPETSYDFNDHHALPWPRDVAFKIICGLMDDDFRIQFLRIFTHKDIFYDKYHYEHFKKDEICNYMKLRGIRQDPKTNSDPSFFGYARKDRVFATNVPVALKKYETDIIIATTKINARSLAKGVSGVVQGEFALHPPHFSVENLGRQTFCTNDQNGIKRPIIPEQIVPSYFILDAQMTLDVRMGYAGCKPQSLEKCYSRMICLIRDSWLAMEMLKLVTHINRDLNGDITTKENDDFLSGFAVDTGDTVIFYVEGPKDGAILQVWEKTGDYYPHMNPMYSSSHKYASRVYPEITFAGTSLYLMVTKMHVPLSAVLACPPVYARPVLPVLARYATLKFGRLLSNRRWWRLGPPTSELPTAAELVSFRQELCVTTRPVDSNMCTLLLKYMPSKSKEINEDD